MITRPTGMTPDNGVTYLDDGRLKLSAEVLNNSEIATFEYTSAVKGSDDLSGAAGITTERAYASLLLQSGGREYAFRFAPKCNAASAPTVTRGKTATTIEFDLCAQNGTGSSEDTLLANAFTIKKYMRKSTDASDDESSLEWVTDLYDAEYGSPYWSDSAGMYLPLPAYRKTASSRIQYCTDILAAKMAVSTTTRILLTMTLKNSTIEHKTDGTTYSHVSTPGVRGNGFAFRMSYTEDTAAYITIDGESVAVVKATPSTSTWYTFTIYLDYGTNTAWCAIKDEDGEILSEASATLSGTYSDIGTVYFEQYASDGGTSVPGLWVKDAKLVVLAYAPVAGECSYMRQYTQTTKKSVYYCMSGALRGACTLADAVGDASEVLWKVRLYDKNSFATDDGELTVPDLDDGTYVPYTKVGYGSLGDISGGGSAAKSVSGYESKQASQSETLGVCYAVFPHTNISFPQSVAAAMDKADGVWYFRATDSEDSDGNEISGQAEIYRYYKIWEVCKDYDPMRRYFLKTAAGIYNLRGYCLFNPGQENSKGSDGWTWDSRGFPIFDGTYSPTSGETVADNFDSYGNPIVGYAEVPVEEAWSETDSGWSDESGDKVGDTYSILTNCIDSPYACFVTEARPTLTTEIVNGYDSGSGSETDPYVLDYCNFEMSGTYTCSSGEAASYYEYKIYDVTGEKDLVCSSGYIYGQDILCSFDRIYNNHTYLVALNVTDTAGQTLSKRAYIQGVFPQSGMAKKFQPTAEYYEPHGSVIIDWSNYTMLTPSNTESCTFSDVKKTVTYNEEDGEETVTVGGGIAVSSVGNYSSDYTLPAGTEGATIAVAFTANPDCSFTSTAAWDLLTFCIGNLTGRVRYSAAEIIVEINGDSKSLQYTFESTMFEDGDPNVWTLAFNRSTCVLRKHSVANIDYMHDYVNVPYSSATANYVGDTGADGNVRMCDTDGCILLFGLMVEAGSNTVEGAKTYAENWYKWIWDDNTVLLANFEGNSLNGTQQSLIVSDISMSGETSTEIVGYRILKQYGENTKLHEIANLTTTDCTVLEDFAVGDNCAYRYFIYPIHGTLDDDGNLTGKCYVNDVVETDEITLDTGVDKVFALTEIDDDVYMVNLSSIWRLYLNLDDTGYTLNNDKTWYDTLATYSQEYVGNRKYISKTITALLGYINCETDGEYRDTYDMLMAWNDFSSSAEMKCLVDVRGLVLPGNFDTNPQVEYMQTKGYPASARFTWRQKADLDIIKIYAQPLAFNPAESDLLVSSDDMYLGVTGSSETVLAAFPSD